MLEKLLVKIGFKKDSKKLESLPEIKLIHDFSESVEWDEALGELKIHGKILIPYQKEYFF